MKKILFFILIGIPSFAQDTIDFDAKNKYILQNREAIASYYAKKFEGRKTASGAIFNNKLFTAAHKTLPFGTKVRVTNLKNNQSVIVVINDRGPFTKGRSIDLSHTAFLSITHNKNEGILNVKIEIVSPLSDEEFLEFIFDKK